MNIKIEDIHEEGFKMFTLTDQLHILSQRFSSLDFFWFQKIGRLDCRSRFVVYLKSMILWISHQSQRIITDYTFLSVEFEGQISFPWVKENLFRVEGTSRSFTDVMRLSRNKNSNDLDYLDSALSFLIIRFFILW